MRGYPMVETFGSRFQMMMSARNRKATIISFSQDDSDAGLYIPGFTSYDTKTSLAARGPKADLERLLAELRE